LGLRAAKDMKIKELVVFGDAKLIVNQVRNIYQTNNPRLKSYRNEVWDLIYNFFSSFNIFFVPREANTLDDSLVVSASNFKIPLPAKPKYNVEVKYRPSLLDNVKHWKVFEDSNDDKNMHANKFMNKIVDHKIVQCPSIHIPKGLVPLERQFDKNDIVVKVSGSKENEDLMECNLGTEEEHKYVKLSSSLSKNQRAEYIKLLKEFSNGFAWKYEHLETYDTSIIENIIPLKYDTKPFRHKLRKINPMLLPIMEKRSKNCLMPRSLYL
jgi:hypothetical protein